MMKSQKSNKVAIVTGDDRREMVRQALTELGEDFTESVKAAKQIFIHPNLVTHFRKTACTNPEAVRGVIDHISLIRGDKVFIGDAGFHSTKKAFQKLDYESLKRSGNIELIDLNDDTTIESYSYTSDLEKKPIPFSKTVAQSDFNIVVVPAKMHSYYMVSLTAKTHIIGSQIVKRSPFGIYARWPWNHTGYKPAHLTLAHVYAEHPAQVGIIDGTEAMEGNGPATGTIVNLGWLIASLNPIVADALASYLMGFEPKEIGYLFHLDKMGFWPINIKEMDIQGPDPKTLRQKLKRPSSYPGIANWQ